MSRYAKLAPDAIIQTSAPFKELARRFHEAKSPEWRKSTADMWTRIQPFLDWVGDREIVTPDVAEEWVKYTTAIGRNDSKVWYLIGNVHIFAKRNGWISGNPLAWWKRPPSKKMEQRVAITYEHWKRIADHLHKSWWVGYIPWVGCYETAMDYVDVATLKWEHIDTETMTITRPRFKMASRYPHKTYTTQLDPSGQFYKMVACRLRWVNGLRNEGSLSKEKFKAYGVYVWPEMLKKDGTHKAQPLMSRIIPAELKPVPYHTLRFTRITEMLRAGIPAHVVMKISGHTTPEMLYHYVGVSPSEAGSAVVQSNAFSRAQCESNLQSPSSSGATKPRISSASTSKPAAESLVTIAQSSSPTTTRDPQGKLRAFLTKRAATLQEAAKDAATAPVTGRLSSTELSSDDKPGRRSA
jgi:integrase